MKKFRDLFKKEIAWIVTIIVMAVSIIHFFTALPNKNKDDIIILTGIVENIRDNHIHTLQKDVEDLQESVLGMIIEMNEIKILIERYLKYYHEEV